MDIENLIESLQNAAGGPEGIKMCHAAATALSTLQTENKKLRAELENYRKGHREEAISTLTPPNEWVNRVRELDELYTKLQIITGFTVEQLLEMFAAGYTLEKPDYSKSFEEMASLAETTPPNEPLTQADLDSMDYDKVWIDYGDDGEWALVVSGRIYSLAVLEGAGFEDILRDEVDGETMDRPSGDYAVYRRPPEGEA